MALLRKAERRPATAPVAPPSQFDAIDESDKTLASSTQAVQAAVVALAKDMEFIGRGGFLLPDVSELNTYIKRCVPHIVKGEYIDSYFVNPAYSKPFYGLKGKGFEADEPAIDQAISKVQPIYETILQNIAEQKDGQKQ